MSSMRIAAIIIICAACTFFERFLPFALFSKHEVPPAVKYLGKVLPTAVMTTLVVYCLRSVSFHSAGGFVPQLAAAGATALLHIWKGNMLLSVGGGTAIYMILLKIM